jgi:hypothetical protein
LKWNHSGQSGVDLERQGFLELSFVVKDRRTHLATRRGWWQRTRWAARLKRMLDAEDRWLPDQSLLRIDVYTKRLDASRDELMDLLATHCRLDLVGDF